MAIASSAMEMRSPAASSMSSSRGGGSVETRLASAIRSSVESPIAETTTTTSWPACLVATTRSATCLILGASATERSEEHTSELQSHHDLVCRLLLEKKKNKTINKKRVRQRHNTASSTRVQTET